MAKTCGIYIITNPIGQSYVGASIKIENRLCRYKNLHCWEQEKIFISILSFGWENHTVDIIKCKDQELDKLERYYINLYDAIKSGLNVLEGGKRGFKLPDHLKQKLALINKGKNVSIEVREKLRKANLGRKRTDKTKKRMSKSHIGIKPTEVTREKLRAWQANGKNPMFGKSHRPETIKKLSEFNRGRKSFLGKNHSDATKEKMRLAYRNKEENFKKGIPGNSKSVIQLSINGDIIKKHDSITLAAKYIGCKPQSIESVLKGRGKTARGFKWQFV